MKLGSLFDGSGGFPLAGAIHGITPVWASEIEPYPIKVTKARFPGMKHLGSVLDVNGAEVEPVDIITFGSPCQDLSVAGKQAGLHKGERSNLFFEAIRIIKEMREATNGKYPRIAVWENVPGAYSSNKGEDFRAVLQAFCSVKDETADVPQPATGKWNRAGAIVGNGWSIAWRTFDAQFWGVPQRRKRIYLIADFGSERAGEILFEPESVRGDFAESGKAGESAAGDAEGGVGRGCAYGLTTKGNGDAFIAEERHMALSCGGGQAGQGYPAVIYPATQQGRKAGESAADNAEGSIGRGGQCLTPWDVQSRRVHDDSGAWPAIYGGEGGGHGYVLRQATPADAEGSAGRGVVYAIDALSSNSMKSPNPNSGFHKEVIAKCLDTSGGNPSCNQGGNVIVQQPCYAVRTRNTMANGWGVSDSAYTLDTSEGQAVCYQDKVGALCSTDYKWVQQQQVMQDKLVVQSVDCRNMNLTNEHGTLQAKENGGQSLNYMGAVCYPVENHPNDSRVSIREDGIVPTLSSRMGTGGNNGPMVLKTAKPPRKYIIRRLTPLECCRLQGFPDWWCDGLVTDEPTDEDVAFWREVFETHRKAIGTSTKPKTDNQIIKWLKQPHTDSAKYKMWGNGIALPNAAHVVGCAIKLIQGQEKQIEEAVMANQCVICGAEMPEGDQVCVVCRDSNSKSAITKIMTISEFLKNLGEKQMAAELAEAARTLKGGRE